jgi:hypothetical protein
MDKNATTIDASINSVVNNENTFIIAYSKPMKQINIEQIIEKREVHALIRPVSLTGKPDKLKPKPGKWNY